MRRSGARHSFWDVVRRRNGTTRLNASKCSPRMVHVCVQVVSPVFRYLAIEIDKKGGAGVEISRRIGYDDANECFCRVDVVK